MPRRPLVLLAIAAGLALPAQAGGAGMITHAFMGDEAIEHVSDPALRSFLTLHRHELLSGASYPDGGYFAGGYGEISHWERFVDSYVQYLRERPGCGDLSNPLGPCAPQVAHMFGTAAHGMGDEIWDWLFEPLVADHGEVPDHPLAPPQLGDVINSIEYAMDTIALADHFRWGESGFYLPPPTELTPVYDIAGHGQTTEADILAGHSGASAALAAERAGGGADAPRVRAQMPWSSAHMHDESGGVYDTAEAIAGYYDSLWAKLLASSPPPPRVVAVHPEDGETGVPFRFHPAKTSPGPHTGGGELRILAVLSSAVEPASVSAESFKLLGPGAVPVALERGWVVPAHERERRAAAAEMPAYDGFPRPGPYGPTDGTHTIMFYPATDLEPCTRYTAVLSRALTDMAELPINTGQPLDRETSWSFETRSAGPGGCPPAGQLAEPLCAGREATIWATGAAPGRALRGTPGNDVIAGGARGEAIRAGAGDDLVCAGRGGDWVRGGGGDDEIRGGRGRDTLRGGRGADLIRGGQNGDRLRGNRGADLIRGGRGRDTLRGGRGADRLRGNKGADRLRGDAGHDRCRGGADAGRDRARGCELPSGVP